MNMLMPKRPAHTPENADTASRSQGRHGKAQQQRAGDHAAEVGRQQRQDLPPLEAVPVFPGDPGVHRAVQQQRTRGDDHIVQAHGQNRRGDQGVAEADQPFDQIGQQLRGKDKQCG